MTTQKQDDWVKSLSELTSESEEHSWSTALLLSLFLGWFGIDRFYLGYTWLGILKLITFGGYGIWWLIDIILILLNKLKDAEGGVLRRW